MPPAIGRVIRDKSWVKRSFLVANTDLDLDDVKFRYFSTAAMKFTDTTPGGNYEINPLPQFTKYCDLSPPNKSRAASSNGMGRFYSEIFDDNSQRIHMRFGVSQFNSLTTFWTSFYNVSAGRLARTGRSPGIAYTLGKLAGMAVPFFFPKLLIVGLVGVGARFFLNMPSSKYYFIKPTMPLYWHAVQTMVNNIAVNSGVVPRLMDGDSAKNFNDGYEFGGQGSLEANKLRDLLPDIFTASGSVNVYALANKAQRLARQQEKLLLAATEAAGNPISNMMAVFAPGNILKPTKSNWDQYMSAWVNNQALGAVDNASGQLGDISAGEQADKQKMKDAAGFLDFFTAEVDDGSAFATFRVNYTGPMNESFSSTVGDSDIQNKVNGMTSQGRSTTFSFAGGNVTDIPLVGQVMSAAKDFVTGIADGLNIAGIGAAMAGAAFVDIPKHWQSSVAQLPRTNYTINLSVPANNPISKLLFMDVPLCMLLCGALPLSTGRQSYTSPFLCEIYDKGRLQIRLGMIDSLSVTRGTGNTGFSPDGIALGYEVTFSVVDMSSIMHMPISAAFSREYTDALGDFGAVAGGVAGGVAGSAAGPVGTAAGATGGAALGGAVGASAGMLADTAAAAVSSIGSLFDDETVFSDYMAVLGSMNLYDQIYGFPKLKVRLTRLATQWETWLSPANYASVMGDSVPGKMLAAFYRGTAKR